MAIDVIYLVEVERRKDEIAHAEQYRLARRLSKRNSPVKEIYYRLLARLGDLLVAWGCQLQTRFASEAEMR
jgi:hypothetical protein